MGTFVVLSIFLSLKLLLLVHFSWSLFRAKARTGVSGKLQVSCIEMEKQFVSQQSRKMSSCFNTLFWILNMFLKCGVVFCA